jgi:hypothetical protein
MILDPNGRPIYNEQETTRHHPWCNYYMRPRQGCKMCERFYLKYPVMENMTETYFPKAQIVRRG